MKNVFFSLFLSTISCKIIYYNTTYIKKDIIIKNKYILNNYNNNSYIFSDINNNIYSIKNEWWKLNFNKVENWNKIQLNQKYTIYGYGIRLKFFDSYPNIIKLNN